MEAFLEILKEINIAQMIIMLAGMWFFYNRLDNKIDKVEGRLNTRIDRLEERINNVEAELTAKINNVEEKLTARIDSVEAKLTARIDNLYNLFANFLYNKKDDKAA